MPLFQSGPDAPSYSTLAVRIVLIAVMALLLVVLFLPNDWPSHALIRLGELLVLLALIVAWLRFEHKHRQPW